MGFGTDFTASLLQITGQDLKSSRRSENHTMVYAVDSKTSRMILLLVFKVNYLIESLSTNCAIYVIDDEAHKNEKLDRHKSLFIRSHASKL